MRNEESETHIASPAREGDRGAVEGFLSEELGVRNEKSETHIASPARGGGPQSGGGVFE